MNLTALVVIAAGIFLQAVGGNKNIPTVPPGIVLAAIAFIAVLLGRPRWLANLGWLVPLVLLVGGIASDPGLVDAIDNPDNATIRTGAMITTLGYLTGIVSGGIGAAKQYQATRSLTVPGNRRS